jgi:hypothetical protein
MLIDMGSSRERYPARAIVDALKGRTVVDASCDGEGMDDVRLLLDDGTTLAIGSELDTSPQAVATAQRLGRPPWPRLLAQIGGRELWPFDHD